MVPNRGVTGTYSAEALPLQHTSSSGVQRFSTISAAVDHVHQLARRLISGRCTHIDPPALAA